MGFRSMGLEITDKNGTETGIWRKLGWEMGFWQILEWEMGISFITHDNDILRSIGITNLINTLRETGNFRRTSMNCHQAALGRPVASVG